MHEEGGVVGIGGAMEEEGEGEGEGDEEDGEEGGKEGGSRDILIDFLSPLEVGLGREEEEEEEEEEEVLGEEGARAGIQGSFPSSFLFPTFGCLGPDFIHRSQGSASAGRAASTYSEELEAVLMALDPFQKPLESGKGGSEGGGNSSSSSSSGSGAGGKKMAPGIKGVAAAAAPHRNTLLSGSGGASLSPPPPRLLHTPSLPLPSSVHGCTASVLGSKKAA